MDDKARIYRFDNVRVDAASFRVWKDERAVQIEPKAFQVLLFLIENRGRLVEKRELLDAVWKETFVTENALTREIAQLRKALGESAREAKYIETVPTKGYRFIADVEVKNGRQAKDEDKKETVEKAYKDESVSASSPVTSFKKEDAKETRRSNQRITFISIAALIFIALAGLLVWYILKRPANETRMVRRITQITTWAGLDLYPSLSPDGSSIAYSSDHNGNFEIYVKPLASGGHEIQLTSDGAQNFEPAWSPDGQYIAYHSRDRGGIWIVPALGGVARRLTEFGSKPAWSRDGSMIAFQSEAIRDLNGSAYGALPPSTIWTAPSRGGDARQITQVGTPQGGHSSPTFYIGDAVGLWKWTSGMPGWLQMVPATGGPQKAVRFYVDPYRPERIYLIASDHAWRSGDGRQDPATDSGPLRALHRPDLTLTRAPHMAGTAVPAHRHTHHEACRSTGEHPPTAANTVRAAQDSLLITNQERWMSCRPFRALRRFIGRVCVVARRTTIRANEVKA